MFPSATSAFALPDHLAAKADPTLIARDEQQFAAIADALEQQVAGVLDRLAVLRKEPGGKGRRAMDRDIEIHHLSARLRVLRRFGLDVCLGRMVATDETVPEEPVPFVTRILASSDAFLRDRAASGRHEGPVYIGRVALADSTGEPLLLDWRAPAAEAFFAATHASPMGLASRRRYRWTAGRVTDFWDEVFTPDGLESRAALDDESAFIASLGSSRSARMRDVLSTIQADQDAIIRAGSRGALVVDGGPGTGKTVVALHRTAYLSTPIPGWVIVAAASSSSDPTRPTCRMSPTSCRASARKASRPSRSATCCQKARPPPRRPTRRSPA